MRIRKLFICSLSTVLLFLLTVSLSHAQRVEIPETCDIVVLNPEKKYVGGHVHEINGYLRGDIIAFDEKLGNITIVDIRGNKHFLIPEDYVSFKEDVNCKKPFAREGGKKGKSKNKGMAKDSTAGNSLELKPRKESEIEITIGFSPYSILLVEGKFEDTNTKANGNPLMALVLNAGIGKYFSRKHFLGVGLDYAILPNHYFGDKSGIKGKISNYFGAGARYKFQYDSYKGNTAWYLLGKGRFTALKGDFDYLYTDRFGKLSITTTSVEEKHSLMGLGVGQGVAFMLENKRSISLELSATRHFTLSSKRTGEPDDPNVRELYKLSNRGFSEIVLSLMFNL